jgi:hypothetical protein
LVKGAGELGAVLRKIMGWKNSNYYYLKIFFGSTGVST